MNTIRLYRRGGLHRIRSQLPPRQERGSQRKILPILVTDFNLSVTLMAVTRPKDWARREKGGEAK
jgi:hypothetical protein